MQVPTDAITRVLGIQGFHVAGLTVLESSVQVRIESDRPEHVCPRCGQTLLFAYDVSDRTVRDLPMCGREVELTFPQYRVLCPCSGRVVTEHLDFVEPYQHQTRRLQESIYWWLRTGTTTSKVAKAFGLSWVQIRHIDARMIRQEQKRQSWVGLRRIGVDEKAVGKGHDYITIISDLDKRRVVFVADGRKRSSLNRFYRRIGKTRAAELEVVTMDMWKPYIQSTKKYAPQADIVFDKFHILRHLNEKIDQLRRELQKKLEKESRQVVKRSRWVLLKASENLTDRQRQTLVQIAQNNQPLYQAYLLKEQFRILLQPADVPTALDRLAGWFSEVYASGLTPLIRFVQQCGRWFEGVANYFKHGATNAFSEAINGRIALMIRLANGFRDREYLKLKIYQQCRDLR